MATDIRDTISFNDSAKRSKLKQEAFKARTSAAKARARMTKEQPQQRPSCSNYKPRISGTADVRPGSSGKVARPKFPQTIKTKPQMANIFDLHTDDDFEFMADDE